MSDLCPEIVIDENVEPLSVYLSFVADNSPEGHIDDAETASPWSNGGDCTVRYEDSAFDTMSYILSLTPCDLLNAH